MKLYALALVLGLTAIQDDPGKAARELIEQFRSGDLETREKATRKLKELGPAAKAEFERAAKDGDAEVARLARCLVDRLYLSASLSARLQAALPGLADNLAFGDDAAWTQAFLTVALKCENLGRLPILTRKELEPLVSRAIRGATTEADKVSVAKAINSRRLYSPSLEVLPLLETSQHGISPTVVEAVNRHPPEAIVRRLVELTRGEDSFLRGRAIEDLGVLGIRDAIPDAVRLLEDPDERVRAHAAEALAELGTKDQFAAMVPLLKDEMPFVRIAALEALGNLYARDAIPRIEELLGDKDGDIRDYALTILADLDARESIPKIIPLLKDPEEDVRRKAVYALRDLRAREAIPEMKALFSDPDDYVQSAALSFLDEVDPKQAVAISLEQLKNPGEALARGRAAAHLGELGGPEAVAGLLEALKDEEDYIGAMAAVALAKLGDRRGLQTLRQYFDKPYGGDYEVMRTLAKLGVKEIIPKVVLKLGDKSEGTRMEAVLALDRLDAKEAAPKIEPLLKDPDPLVRHQAVFALAKLRGRESLPQILPLLHDKERLIVWATLISLALIKAWDVEPEVVRFLDDLEPTVRFQAASWLARAGSTKGVPEMLDQDVGHISYLNALRQPDVWKRLEEMKAPGDLQGTVLQKIERVAQAAGLKVEVEPFPLGDLQRKLGRRHRDEYFSAGLSVQMTLWQLVPRSCAFVLEKDRIRLMSREAGERFWREWWKERQSAPK